VTTAAPAQVTAPDVQGMDSDEASAALVSAGLSVGAITEAHSASVAEGEVMSQVPAAGATAPAGSSVALVISEGRELVRVPLVVGRTESRAKERIKEAGFKVKVVRAKSAEERGTVISQKPSRQKASPGKTITITVSTGGGLGGTAETRAARGSGSSDDAAARAFEQHENGVQLTGEGTVSKVLADDNDGDRHQRFILRLDSGQTLLIAHNIDIAPRVPGLAAGDSVAFKGEYEWNAEGGVVHWTHHDPDGDHTSGWLKHDGKTYK
jgi:hypothetical protein